MLLKKLPNQLCPVYEQERARGHEEAVDGGDESQHEKQWKGEN